MSQGKLAASCNPNAHQLVHLKQMLVILWCFAMPQILEYRQELLYMPSSNSTGQSENCAY